MALALQRQRAEQRLEGWGLGASIPTSERDAAQRSLQRAASQLSDAVQMLEPYRLLNRGFVRNARRGTQEETTPPV